MNWIEIISSKRFGKEDAHRAAAERRTEFQRDYDRLIFSAPFRRMQNKTQVFPLPGSVFVHNRLTHSLEVSSVGRSLGADVADELSRRYGAETSEKLASLGAIVSAACLAHDMGNPPFGHSGERAIRSYFAEGDGRKWQRYLSDDGDAISPAQWSDLTRFDGNANTFRLLTHQFNGRRRGGYVMCYSTLAAIVKYPYSSTLCGKRPKFGFFESERADYLRIARALGMPVSEEDGAVRGVRHPLVYLVEAADDICYEVMDIEDAYKLRLLSGDEALSLLLGFFTPEEQAGLDEAYPRTTDVSDRIGYYRSCVVGALERACVRTFVEHEEEMLAGTFGGTLIDHLPEPLLAGYRRCEDVARRRIYCCKEVTDIDLAGYQIIYTLLSLFTEAVLEPGKAYSELLLNQVSAQYQLRAPKVADRLMAVLDYVSGMTDVYALDLYRKINGHSLPSV